MKIDYQSEKYKKARIATQNWIKACIFKIKSCQKNMAIYDEFFAGLSDEEFVDTINKFGTGELIPPLIDPNYSSPKITIENNLIVAKELGLEFMKKIWIGAANGRPAYLTPIKYPVYMLPLRRQAQLATKKISIPEDNSQRDDMTGQATGKSKGSSISFTEIYVLQGIGCEAGLEEMLKYRGGDNGGFHAMNVFASRYGSVSLKAIERFSTGVEATKALRAWLTCMHFETTMPNQPLKAV